MAEWTTEDVRETLVRWVGGDIPNVFDATMAAHDAEVRAKALEDAADDWDHPGPAKYTAIDVSVELHARALAEREMR